MNHRRFFFTGLAALVGVAALLALRAGGQVSPDGAKAPPTIVEVGPDNVPIERTFDGKLLRVTQREANAAAQNPGGPKVEYREEEYDRRRPDGSIERITVQVPVNPNYAPTGYGARYPAGDTWHTQDAESQKLLNQEIAAAADARALLAKAQQADSDGEKADAKKKLRERLAQIFDLQQERRTREIAKIEERLGKLKETLKKRDTSKDSIIDRRLESITGGVDELGWEESLPTSATPYGLPAPSQHYPPVVPRAGGDVPGGSFALPPTTPGPPAAEPPSAEPRFAPPPVAPRAGSFPTPVPPAPAVPPAAAPPPLAPVPAALPVPAPPRR